MLKTSGHVKKYYKPCCTLYESFKDKKSQPTFEEFLKSVEKESQTFSDKDEQLVFKGDMLEILAEIFFKAFSNSPTVGLSDYTPIPLEEDYGVDGTGTNAAGTPCAVQVKYRDNPLESVRYSEIARTYTSGQIQLGLSLDKNDCIFVFTSAYDVTVSCKTVFDKKLRVLNRDIIAKEIDNNESFWNFAFNEIKDTLLPGKP